MASWFPRIAVLYILLFQGGPEVEPILGVFSIPVGVAFAFFALIVWKNTANASWMPLRPPLAAPLRRSGAARGVPATACRRRLRSRSA